MDYAFLVRLLRNSRVQREHSIKSSFYDAKVHNGITCPQAGMLSLLSKDLGI